MITLAAKRIANPTPSQQLRMNGAGMRFYVYGEHELYLKRMLETCKSTLIHAADARRLAALTLPLNDSEKQLQQDLKDWLDTCSSERLMIMVQQ